jgi:hypothetical protein
MFVPNIYCNDEYRNDDKDEADRQELTSFSDDPEENHLVRNYNVSIYILVVERIMVFWNVMACSYLDGYKWFEGTCYIHSFTL